LINIKNRVFPYDFQLYFLFPLHSGVLFQFQADDKFTSWWISKQALLRRLKKVEMAWKNGLPSKSRRRRDLLMPYL